MPTPSSRPYHSPRRQQAARETRLAVLGAAREQFVRRGYAATSLAAIAEAAGVSLATVKLVAGTKARLLAAAVAAVIQGDDPGAPIADQAWWREMLAGPDPGELVRRFAAACRSALEQQAALFEVVFRAAPGEPELAQLEERASLGRWHDVRQVAQALADAGGLRGDLDVDAAADVIWALASPQMFRLLVGRRGWPADRWEEWLRAALEAQLLDPTRRR